MPGTVVHAVTAGIVALSGLQARALLEDKLDGTGPCRVSDCLPWPDLAATGVVPGARILMSELAGAGAKLTPRGNLNRKLVELLMNRSQWSGFRLAELRSVCKVFNEQDFAPAMYLHGVLRLMGLARHHRGLLKLTRKGRDMLADEAAGRLQADLFRTTFTRYNLAYLDRWSEPDIYGRQISLILFLIGQFCTDWQPGDALMRSVTLPTGEASEPDTRLSHSSRSRSYAFTNRVLNYLCWFGLLEEGRAAANDDWGPLPMYRKTPLYDRALVFALE
jgi:hypothetical protein